MSRSIDERVVEMQFQNHQFETGVKQSLTSLDNLKKGIDNVGGKNSALAGISEGVETIASRFSNMGAIAITALQNITNKVVDLGLQMVKSLTVDQVSAGFQEYELKMGSIQTIMAGTGETLPVVNKYLNELNTYADKTIYSFADMTQNIGKFTNAGVKLDAAVAAIQGIANVAAVSGANTNEASRAMYNFAQALSAGYVKLIDWKSIENANMATVEFKTQLLEAAVAAGTVTKTTDGMYRVLTTNNKGDTLQTAINATKNFNDSLQYQWMTTEALVDTLGKYADETTEIGKKAFAAATEVKTFSQLMDTLKEAAGSGWAKSFEIIIGDFDQAKELFTMLSNVVGGFIDKTSDARNEMLQFWADNGGRVTLIEAFKNAFDALGRIILPIKEAFREFFPATTGQRLVDITTSFKEFTERLKIGDETSDKLKRTFSGLFAALDLVGQGIGFLFKVAGEIFTLFGGPTAKSILDVTANIGDFIVQLNQGAKDSAAFQNAFEKVQNVLMGASDAIHQAIPIIKEAFEKVREVFIKVSDTVKDAITRIKDSIQGFKSIDIKPIGEFSDKTQEKLKPLEVIGKIISSAFEIVVRVLEWAAPICLKLGQIVGQALGSIADKVSYAVQNMDFSEILNLINTGLFGALILGIKNFFGSLTDATSGAKGFLEGVTGILDGVRGSLEAWQTNLQAKTLLTIATAVGILAAALFVLSGIPSEELSVGLAGLTVIFTELTASLIILQTNLKDTTMTKVSTQLIAMAAALLILSHAMQNLAELDWDGIGKGTVGIAALAAVLVGMAKVLESNTKGLITGGLGLIEFAAAILILSHAMGNFAQLSWDEIARGLTAMAGAITAVTVAVNFLPKGMVTKSLGMIEMGAALLIIGNAMKTFASLQWEEIARGLTAMAGALAAITLAMNLLPSGMITKSLGMIEMGAALLIIGDAVKKFGSMQWDEIARGLVALTGALTAITLAMNLMPKDMVGKALGLIGVATALEIMIGPLQEMSQFTWEEIAKGLVTLAGAMGILAVALNVMTGTLSGSAALLVAATSIAILAPVLKSLGEMDLIEIGTALLALAGVLAVLGGAAAILQPLVPTMVALSVSIVLLGAGVGLVGLGVLSLSIGLTALSVSATAAAGAIVIIVSAILSLIPLLFEKIGEGIIALGNVIIDGAPVLGEALVALVVAALDSLEATIPDILETLLVILIEALTALENHLPELTEKLFNVVIGFIQQLALRMPELIGVGADLLRAIFGGIFDELGFTNSEGLVKFIGGIALLLGSMVAMSLAKQAAKDALITAGLMAAVMAIMTAVFLVINALKIDEVLDICLGMSAVMLAITAALVVLSLIPIPAALSAVGSLAVFVGGLTAVLAAVGGLRQIPGLDWLIGEGAEFLVIIGKALGEFVGSIIGGFLEGITGSFPQIGKDLSDFMSNVTPFVEGAKKIDSSVINGVKALAETVLILTASSLLNGLTSWLTGGSSMVQFGEEISKFAPYFASYYNSIKGVDARVVEASGNAALALAEFASKIPNQGGMAAWFAGENSLTAFAEELVKFGPPLMAYSKSVTGLNADVVTNSAHAALALAEMAANLPNQGGMAAWFAGENNLSLFAEELVKFGPALKKYADSVNGLDPTVVVNSANAAITLSEMAANLPNQGGMVAWFTGENSLSIFGAELAKFGPYLKQYASTVSGLDASVVANSTNAAKALSELASNLPNQGGMVSWFTGDNTMASFGEGLYQFGWYFRLYCEQISGISFSQMSGVISGIKALVELAQDIQKTNSGVFVTFATDLNKAGQMGVQEFLKAFDGSAAQAKTSAINFVNNFVTEFTNAQSKVTDAGKKVGTAAETGLKTNQAVFGQTGSKYGLDFSTELTNKQTTAQQAGRTVATSAETGIKSNMTVFGQVGSQNGLNYMQGLQSYQTSIMEAGRNVCISALNGLKANISEFTSVGEQAGRGFRDGLSSMIKEAGAAAKRLAEEAARAAKAALQVASPSKLFRWIAEMTGEGFVEGLLEMVGDVRTSAEEMGNTALTSIKNVVSKISDVVNADVDMVPTIRPVIDLTNVQNGVAAIDQALNTSRQLDLSVSRKNAQIAFAEIPRGTNSQNKDTDTTDGQTPSQQFIQHNYSPKALSRLEIYRQTKNLFAQQKVQAEGV